MHLTVRITGDKEEIAKFKKLGDKLTDFTSAMKEIGTELKTYYGKQVFASEGGVYGNRWVGLSPVYKKWKGRHYPGKGIMTASGALSKSFVADTTKNSATITNNRRTANGRNLLEIHQKGLGHNPVRPILLENHDVEEIVKHIVEDDVKRKLAAV